MNQFLGILLPAVFGMHVYEKITKKEIKFKEWIKKYLIFILFVNIVNYTIVIYIAKQEGFIFTNQFTLKYLILGIFVSIIISFIIAFVEKNMEVNIRIDKDEK